MNLALFFHIAGAMIFVGSLALVAGALAERNLRLAFRGLLYGVLAGWVVMRGGAEWVASEQGVNDLDDPPAWVDLGYSIADPALLLILIATVCAGLAASRERTDRLRVASLVLVVVLLAASVVAIWAMTTKPT